MPVDLSCYRTLKAEWLPDLAAAVSDDLQEAELHALRDELKGLREREAARMAAMRAKASQEEAVAAEEEGVPPA